MRHLALAAVALATLVSLVSTAVSQTPKPGASTTAMELGNFSVSLAVKDLAASKAFYEKLGFRATFGEATQGWLILQNKTATIGLFQGMFDKNVLTFNPGWTREGKPVGEFEDVRDLQARLLAAGLELTTKADAASTGPASFTLADPDGNMILVDQHVARPKK